MLRKIFWFFFLLMVAVVMLPVGAGAQTATETTLYSFCNPSNCFSKNAGNSSLIQGADGNFYGTSGGYAYKITPAGVYSQYQIPYSYDEVVPSLIQAGDGNFYGLAEGEIFTLTPAGVVTSVAGAGGDGALIQGADGNFYGVNAVYFFGMTPSGDVTDLYGFCNPQYSEDNCPFGSSPVGSLVQGLDGNLYGVTTAGGGESSCNSYQGCGTVFGITPAGAEYSAVAFGILDMIPSAQRLVEGPGSLFYGTTPFGAYGYGEVFESAGGVQDIYAFCPTGTGCSDGRFPAAGVFLGSDGNFYGTTSNGGPNGYGTVFKLTPGGTLTTVYTFCSLSNCPDGSYPESALNQGSDGALYGTTAEGGANGGGTLFKLSLTPGLPAPVQLSFPAVTAGVGNPVTLSWSVLNAFSMTMQQCYAFVMNNATGAGTWTGLQAGTLTNGIYSGSATITPTAAGAYTYALTCGGMESASTTLLVGGAKSPSATTLSSNSPVVIGSLVKLSVASTTNQFVGPLTGTVKFSYGSLSLGTVNLTNGAASLNVTAQGIPTGTYNITATYSGDSNYQPSVGTASVTVLGYGTETALSASTGQVTQGQPVTLSAGVARSSVSGTPSGNVTFSYGSTVLGTAKLVGGAASFTAATNGSIPPGTYGVTAKYDGDSTDQSSVSSPVNVTVIAATETSLAVSPNPVPKDSAVTLTSVVQRKYNGGVPTGSITFKVGSYVVGTQALDGTGTAVVNASDVGIAAGTYPVTASYSGDAGNAASTSPVVDVVVQ